MASNMVTADRPFMLSGSENMSTAKERVGHCYIHDLNQSFRIFVKEKNNHLGNRMKRREAVHADTGPRVLTPFSESFPVRA